MRKTTLTLATLALLFADRGDACGPDFAPSLFFFGSEGERVYRPFSLDAELTRAAEAARPELGLPARPETVRKDVEAVELREALTARGLSARRIDEIVDETALYRPEVDLPKGLEPTLWEQITYVFGKREPGTRPAELPREFALYFDGLNAMFTQEDDAPALETWAKLLALPRGERLYRTTWAHYMRGNVLAGSGDAAGAIREYELLRAAAKDGFRDGLGLAASSFRREYEVAKHAKRPVAAFAALSRAKISGYTVDRTTMRSAFFAMLRAESHDDDAVLAAPDVAAMVNAFILGEDRDDMARFDEKLAARWFARVDGKVTGAERLAWGAYWLGKIDEAKRWLARADRETALAQWVSSRLEAREGDLAKSLALARQAIARWESDNKYVPYTLPPEQIYRLWTWQAGQLAANRGETMVAIDLLMRGDHWVDAAFLAERVAPLGELKTFCAALPTPPPRVPKADEYPPEGHVAPQDLPAAMRLVLARRLFREKQDEEQALAWFPPGLAPAAKDYVGLRRKASAEKDPAKRAELLFQIAQVERHNGLELLGTETTPDWAAYSGNYEHEAKPVLGMIKVPLPFETRFHYRNVAAAHAQEAAALLPSKSARRCEMLGTAGRWLKDRHKDQAQRLYKEAIATCFRVEGGSDSFDKGWGLIY